MTVSRALFRPVSLSSSQLCRCRPFGVVHVVLWLWTGVDIGEAMKTGALWWRVAGETRDLQNPWVALQWGEKYLHMSDGMYFADEEVTYLGQGPQPTGNMSGGHTAGTLYIRGNCQ